MTTLYPRIDDHSEVRPHTSQIKAMPFTGIGIYADGDPEGAPIAVMDEQRAFDLGMELIIAASGQTDPLRPHRINLLVASYLLGSEHAKLIVETAVENADVGAKAAAESKIASRILYPRSR